MYVTTLQRLTNNLVPSKQIIADGVTQLVILVLGGGDRRLLGAYWPNQRVLGILVRDYLKKQGEQLLIKVDHWPPQAYMYTVYIYMYHHT